MKLAGLDIASTTGLAIMHEDRRITTETFRAAGKKRFLEADDKQIDSLRMGEAGVSFENHLHTWLIVNQIDHVAIEAPLNTNFMSRKRPTRVDPGAAWAGQAVEYEEVGSSLKAFFKIHGLEFLACTVCSRLNIPTVFVPQQTWRKAFLGSGKASKNAKKDARVMCEKMNIACTTDDAAESAGVVFWLDTFLNPYQARRANDLFAKATASPG